MFPKKNAEDPSEGMYVYIHGEATILGAHIVESCMEDRCISTRHKSLCMAHTNSDLGQISLPTCLRRQGSGYKMSYIRVLV